MMVPEKIGYRPDSAPVMARRLTMTVYDEEDEKMCREIYEIMRKMRNYPETSKSLDIFLYTLEERLVPSEVRSRLLMIPLRELVPGRLDIDLLRPKGSPIFNDSLKRNDSLKLARSNIVNILKSREEALVTQVASRSTKHQDNFTLLAKMRFTAKKVIFSISREL